ncbi:nucleoside phosphorylase domain-containing protein [Trichoderma compactum]
MPWHGNYTVGWVCTLPLEFEISKGMLDYWYRQPPQNNHDPYENHCRVSYAYGRIGHHDVVMACLPSNENATVSVSDVLHEMRESFPFLRLFLMAGIGGGFPCISEDVQWGDDVVGDPAINPGAVIQHDSDRIRREGMFVQKGSLSMLPEDLQTAMRTLKADHQSGHTFSEHSQAVLERCEDVDIHYRQPIPETDVLFSIQDDPLGAQSNCPQCPKGPMELRRARSSESIRHCGPIASGNEIRKHRATKDGLPSKNGTKCFQTEAAGLTDGFHCFAIRGISGYADSYKNGTWQPCAAAIAAEYAKELLHIFPPVPSSISPDVWYRLTKYLSYTKSIDIEQDSTSADGGMRITLELNDTDQLSHVLGVDPGDETRLRLEPAAFDMRQQWQVIQRGGGAVNIWNRSLGSQGYLCTRGYPAGFTLSGKNDKDASQLWRLHPVGIVGRQCSQADHMVID